MPLATCLGKSCPASLPMHTFSPPACLLHSAAIWLSQDIFLPPRRRLLLIPFFLCLAQCNDAGKLGHSFLEISPPQGPLRPRPDREKSVVLFRTCHFQPDHRVTYLRKANVALRSYGKKSNRLGLSRPRSSPWIHRLGKRVPPQSTSSAGRLAAVRSTWRGHS